MTQTSYRIQVAEDPGGRNETYTAGWARSPEQVAAMREEIRQDMPRGTVYSITVTEQ